ncbi:unnamed protein product [Phytophthora fragariaefolia]|uniref:Unnamed protein product n=1 Tax=Phytophthora fragariaefolia TaxID=1490495 RepID=A0A9W6XUP4_9STRA|nr:unnamed protein product [Phytophthora fragariaefolia]
MRAASSGRLIVLVWSFVLNALRGGVTADCAAGSSTLTTEGCSGCGEYDLCLGFSSDDECSGSGCVTDGDCTYECMSVNANLSMLVVLIEFGGFKSSKEVAAGGYTSADLAGYPDFTDKWPSANNDDVTAVSTIDLSSAVTTLYVRHSTLLLFIDLTDKLMTRSLTRDQADFLNSLETLILSDSDFTVGLDCDEMEQVKVQDVTVCLSDGIATSKHRASASSSAGVDGSDVQSTSNSSSSTSLIVGIVCGVLAVIVAAIIFVVYRRKKRNFTNSKLSSTADDHLPSSNSDHERRHQSYDALRTSTGIPMGIPMSAGGVAVGIPTTATKDEATTGVPTSVESAATYLVSSSDAVPRKKPSTFLSVWSDPELLSVQVRVEDIEDLSQLGSGAFATVWLVRYRNSKLLASKRLRPERRTKKHTSNFVEEIKLIANFEHPNLVKFIGAAWTIESDLQALLKYMDGGDLRQYLADACTPFGWSLRKFDIAIGIIETLVYLHSFAPPIVHRDLKSKNVLLSADAKAKLSDFGTSRFRSVENTMTAGVGTGRWLAPEVIRGDTDYGSSADIYSFGALLTELDTNQIPYSNIRGSNGKILSDMTILHHVATGKLRPEVRSTCEESMKALVERCLVEDPTKRPAATVIAYELRVLQKEKTASL